MFYKLLVKYSLKKVIDYLTARRLFSSIKHGAVFVFKDNKAGVLSFTLREENENIFMFCRQPPCWRADGESVISDGGSVQTKKEKIHLLKW